MAGCLDAGPDGFLSLATDNYSYVILGRITGLYGVHGGVKIQSYTRPRERIFSYHPWYLRRDRQWMESPARRERSDVKGIIAVISGIEDRDAASPLLGSDIAVRRDQLPGLGKGEFYQVDLIGLELKDISGKRLGRLTEIEETGANDVMLVEGAQSIRIPLVMGRIVKNIDLGARVILVDWDPEYQ